MTGYPTRLIIILLLISSGSSFAEQGFWRDIGPDPNLVSDDVTAIQISDEISSIRYFDSDEQALRSYLDQVPLEQSGDDSYTIRLPMPDGSPWPVTVLLNLRLWNPRWQPNIRKSPVISFMVSMIQARPVASI